MDRWDVVGGIGAVLVAVGVGVAVGLAWGAPAGLAGSAIFVGALLMSLYIAREVRQ